MYSAHMKVALQVPSLGETGGCATGPYRTPTTLKHTTMTESKQLYLIHRNKHREAAKTKRKRNMAQMKEQIKTPVKELNEMELSNLSDAKSKILMIRMLKELSEDLNSIKKIQSEMKDILIEIKNNLPGKIVKCIKPRIKSMLWNKRKQKTTNQNYRKK